MNRIFDRGPRRVALATALLASTAIAVGGFAWSRAEAASPVQAPLELPPVANQAGFAALVAKVKPAVVNIATSEMAQPADTQEMQRMPELPQGSPFGDMFKQFFDHQGGEGAAVPEHALGSGFIVDPAGYIVTNNHVVKGATQVTVTLQDGSSFPAKIVGRDPKTDLAVLKIDAGKPLPYVAFGNSDKEAVGDWVVAVGNPFGLGGTVTAGIVSAHDRDINDGPYDDFLQIDAPINPGNSGGPLFNQSGQVIGIDTAIYSPNGGSVGIGFAIPSNIAKHIVAQLREHGSVERGWLGISMQPLTEPLAKAVGLTKDEGVLVDQVEANSPAAHAHLQQGDVITAYDGKPVTNARDFAMAVADTQPGNSAHLTVWRDGDERTVDVTIAKQSGEQVAEAGSATTDEAPVGMMLAPLSSNARQEMGLAPNAKGVVVASVTPGSRADQSGVEAGDLIVKVGNDAVTTPGQVAAQIHDAEHAKKQAIPLLVSRNGTAYYLALQLA